jgi:hypothetical protein
MGLNFYPDKRNSNRCFRMINLSPEREAELLAEYKARKTAITNANEMLEKMRADQKLKQEKFWERINKPHSHKLEKPQKCVCCNASIPAGSVAVVKAKLQNVSGSGWNGQFLTEYTCLVCSNQLKKVQL